MKRKVCIFCGANKGLSTAIINQAEELCDLLVENNFDLVYGGGRTGLMGIIADKFLKENKSVIGVRPEKLINDEDCHQNLTELIVVASMQDRKSKMIELGDFFIALPGGVGTLDEIIESFTLYKIGFINKTSGILNTSNYYDGLKILINNMVDNGFLKKEAKETLIFASTPRELLIQLNMLPVSKDKSKEIDKVAFIDIYNGKILSTKSFGKNTYYIPGGKREKGETDNQTLIREIEEELSVNIIPDSINYVGTFTAQADGKTEGVVVKMTCYKGRYKESLKASNEIQEIKWLNFSDIDKVSEVDKIIFKFLKSSGELK